MGNPHCWQSLFDPVALHLATSEWRLERVLDLLNPMTRRVYRRRDTGHVKSTIHWGQRKLLLSEIEFLTGAIGENAIAEGRVVIYAGAAPGDHLPLLIKLFGAHVTKWELFDRTPFNWKPDDDKILINRQYLDTAQVSRLQAEYKGWDILLISDIRSSDFTQVT